EAWLPMMLVSASALVVAVSWLYSPPPIPAPAAPPVPAAPPMAELPLTDDPRIVSNGAPGRGGAGLALAMPPPKALPPLPPTPPHPAAARFSVMEHSIRVRLAGRFGLGARPAGRPL